MGYNMLMSINYNLIVLMNKNILIPGGIGYIGSHVVVELLLKTNYNLIVIDNYLNSSQTNMDNILLTVKAQISHASNFQKMKNRVSFYEGSILDLSFLDNVFRSEKQKLRHITSVIHFAAKKSAPESVNEPLDYYENNVVGSMNILKTMEKYETCKEFIFSSTAAVYGEQDNCTQQYPCKPITPYGESKVVVQMLLKSMAKQHKDWKIIMLRYFNPAGNHQLGLIGDNPIDSIPGNLFSIIQHYIIGKRQSITVFGDDYSTPDKSGVRDFIHVVDLAEGHISALNYLDKMLQTNCEVFNLGSGSGYSVIEVLKTFEDILNVNINYVIGKRRVGDLQRLVAVVEKAQKVLGWKTKKSLREMCESCIKFTNSLMRGQYLNGK